MLSEVGPSLRVCCHYLRLAKLTKLRNKKKKVANKIIRQAKNEKLWLTFYLVLVMTRGRHFGNFICCTEGKCRTQWDVDGIVCGKKFICFFIFFNHLFYPTA